MIFKEVRRDVACASADSDISRWRGSRNGAALDGNGLRYSTLTTMARRLLIAAKRAAYS